MEKTLKIANSFVFMAIAALGLACAVTPEAIAGTPWTLSGALTTHDPDIQLEGSTYWIMETTSDGGIGVKYSSNGTAWTQGSAIFGSGLSWWKTYNPSADPAQVWAPGCINIDGTTGCYYAVSQFGSQKSAIGLTTSVGGISAGKWVDQGAVITSSSSSAYNAIDPQPVTDYSGTLWVSFGSAWDGIYITQANSSTFKPTGSVTNIARDTSQVVENSFIVKHVYNGKDYYYLFLSKGSCCSGSSSTYHIVVGRSQYIDGPYVDNNGTSMMDNGSGLTIASSGSRYIAPGGESAISDTTMAWYALDSENSYNPVLFIETLSWNSSGWPNSL
jgi:arabinan endo-1,5-alpha-L-arabinosidase